MSAIKRHAKYIFALCLLVIAGASYFGLAKTSSQSFDKDPSHITPWNGKSGGPVQVRVLEVSKDDDVVTLEGQVTSKFDNINLEWKLPDGVGLISGALQETAAHSNEGPISRTIIVKVAPGVDPSRIVFFAYAQKGNDKVGMTYVHNLRETEEEKEKLLKIQKIQKFMKARDTH